MTRLVIYNEGDGSFTPADSLYVFTVEGALFEEETSESCLSPRERAVFDAAYENGKVRHLDTYIYDATDRSEAGKDWRAERRAVLRATIEALKEILDNEGADGT